MRLYIPATSADIARDRLLPRVVHAVTPELRAAMPEEDGEVLESVAMSAAADDSLRILATLAGGGETIRPLRVVIVAEARDSDVENVGKTAGDDLLPTAVRLAGPLGWEEVTSIHVDDDGVLDDLLAAMAGDEDAFERVAEEDLMWYDVDERGDLVAYFG